MTDVRVTDRGSVHVPYLTQRLLQANVHLFSKIGDDAGDELYGYTDQVVYQISGNEVTDKEWLAVRQPIRTKLNVYLLRPNFVPEWMSAGPPKLCCAATD